jgi:hypothetical protein
MLLDNQRRLAVSAVSKADPLGILIQILCQQDPQRPAREYESFLISLKCKSSRPPALFRGKDAAQQLQVGPNMREEDDPHLHDMRG